MTTTTTIKTVASAAYRAALAVPRNDRLAAAALIVLHDNPSDERLDEDDITSLDASAIRRLRAGAFVASDAVAEVEAWWVQTAPKSLPFPSERVWIRANRKRVRGCNCGAPEMQQEGHAPTCSYELSLIDLHDDYRDAKRDHEDEGGAA